ncbi:hypothetical protein TL16_g12829 [Triparma laevis f. inornata]|uniref:Protein kinase domain-containing protein n=1 Tax=Triparma laevis f. inornata TaxID=1714386 RepID=A0A9W7BXF4_9STRA|nr:hypothetical protein TL16_g12829 [Triparma laevis f. inornata]
MFTTLSLLGSGTFADVHKVKDKEGKLWAVKRNRRSFRGEKDRLLGTREVRTMQHLQSKLGPSKYLLSYHRSWSESSHFYVQTELCSSHTLAHYRERNIVSVELGYKIINDVSRGLKAIHECNMVHMDIKPGNLLLSLSGNVKIGDFGVTCEIGSGMEGDEGDSRYLSLEALEGERRSWCDVFSLGVSVWECLGGEVAGEGEVWRRLRNERQEVRARTWQRALCTTQNALPILTNPNALTTQCGIEIITAMLGPKETRPTVSQCITTASSKMLGNFLTYVNSVEEEDRRREEERAERYREMRRRRNTERGIDRVCTPTQGVEGWGAF